MAKYDIEIWSKDGRPMGNIRPICSNLRWQKTRNEAEQVEFTLNLTKYEEYVKAMGFGDNPYDFMEVGRNDVRIKRNGRYLVGANIIKFGFNAQDPSITMTVSATGYLNYYKNRFCDINYTNTPQHQILWGVINQCNQEVGGDYGIRQGTHKGAVVVRDRNQVRKEVKSFFQQMSQVIGGCDFEFTPDKKLNTYEAIGTYRPEIVLRYPDNIAGFSFERSVDNVSNFVYAIGSGNGEDAVQTTTSDTDSANYLYRRERIVSYNSVTDETTLAQNAAAVLHYSKEILELPTITVPDGVLDLSTLSVGDSITLEMLGNVSLNHINGIYRIESIAVNVDDNDAETVTLTFDDLDIQSIIDAQESE